jgi:class 3 adenylate cyclase
MRGKFKKLIEYPIVNKKNGFIDKFIGDSIMALFTHHPEDALKSGIEMLNALKIINIRRNQKGYDNVNIGIGIHTGALMLGTVGSEDRMETTVIGDTVNLAARLESQTKVFGNDLIISDNVYKMIKKPEDYYENTITLIKHPPKENWIGVIHV